MSLCSNNHNTTSTSELISSLRCKCNSRKSAILNFLLPIEVSSCLVQEVFFVNLQVFAGRRLRTLKQCGSTFQAIKLTVKGYG